MLLGIAVEVPRQSKFLPVGFVLVGGLKFLYGMLDRVVVITFQNTVFCVLHKLDRSIQSLGEK